MLGLVAWSTGVNGGGVKRRAISLGAAWKSATALTHCFKLLGHVTPWRWQAEADRVRLIGTQQFFFTPVPDLFRGLQPRLLANTSTLVGSSSFRRHYAWR